MATAAIERTDLDGAGKPCSEGWFGKTGAGEIILMPPGSDFAAGLVALGYANATQADVDALPLEPGAKGTAKRKPHRFAHDHEIAKPETAPAP